MKSSKEELRSRGFVDSDDINEYLSYSDSELIQLMNSPMPFERSVSVKVLSGRLDIENPDFVKKLLERLCIEKSLYTKLEICNALEKGEIETAKQMVQYLGRIGNNQHKCLPETVSKKKCYPLARDIIARSLGRMDCSILPVLFDVLNSNKQERISEVIDAIGYMLFYNPECANANYFEAIIKTMNEYSDNNVIVWKCVECLSSFRMQGSINALNKIINDNKHDTIINEAKRSRKLISVFKIVHPRDFYNDYNQQILKKSIEQLKSGKGKTHELIDVED